VGYFDLDATQAVAARAPLIVGYNVGCRAISVLRVAQKILDAFGYAQFQNILVLALLIAQAFFLALASVIVMLLA
jgi:hypothetical protein